jgi:2-polyprenyl-3-methyl-5-hydroxy-6-metoxy-1,4-benzoquinol methylase
MIEITAPTSARTSGHLEDRLAGLRDLLPLAAGSTILDLGTNRGLIALEFARNGAALVHGCDLYAPGIEIAREIFKEVDVTARFEIVDLSCPFALESAFGADYRPRYDIVLFLGVYQHLKKQMSPHALHELVQHLASRTGRFFAYRTTPFAELETALQQTGLMKVHFSQINRSCGPCGIWERRD